MDDFDTVEVMTTPRARTLPAAMLLAAVALALATGPAGARPKPTPTPTPAATPPAAPTDLRVAAVTTTSVTLAWTASQPGSNPVAGYTVTYNEAYNDIYRLLPAGDGTTVTITAGIRATGQYTFRVHATDTAGARSVQSATVGVVTPASDTAADQSPPSAPTDLRVTATGPAGATLAWSPSTDDAGVTGYVLYRFDGLFVSTPVATVTGTTATVPGGTTGAQSLYVRARDAAGNLSATSNPVSAPATTPTPSPPARG